MVLESKWLFFVLQSLIQLYISEHFTIMLSFNQHNPKYSTKAGNKLVKALHVK